MIIIIVVIIIRASTVHTQYSSDGSPPPNGVQILSEFEFGIVSFLNLIFESLLTVNHVTEGNLQVTHLGVLPGGYLEK